MRATMEPQQKTSQIVPLAAPAPSVVTLKSKMDMVAALNAVKVPEHFRQKLFPLVLKHAGANMKVAEVVWMLVCAVEEYAAGFSGGLRTAIYAHLPLIADAIIVDNKLAMEVKSLL